jgi:pyridinium-3,5-bisthiocarboxylic acid mononucleotide nickel chelatase
MSKYDNTMKAIHFDCFSGISGDMVLGALLSAGLPESVLRSALDSLTLPITLEIEPVKRCGFAAVKATIIAEDEEHYRFLPDIDAILKTGTLTVRQYELAMQIFTKLADAEAAAHGMPIEKVHFHEVGALDSIADIVGAAVGLDWLAADRITCSSVPTGIGTVRGAHGIMPIPTPGTAALLKGVPIAPSEVKFELTTPTGAAILATVVHEFTDSPSMTITSIGHGAGTKDFIDRPNILRVFVGTAADATAHRDTVVMMETNLDDCPGEIIGYTLDRLLAAGALDAYAMPIQMKKNRPGVILTVIATAEIAASLETILFAETATFGIRKRIVERVKMARSAMTVPTPWGPVMAKQGMIHGLTVVTPEYEDCARVARLSNIPLRTVYDAVRNAKQ